MKSSELRDKNKDELMIELAATQKELFSLRLQRSFTQDDATKLRLHSFKQARRKIARIKTILHEQARENHE